MHTYCLILRDGQGSVQRALEFRGKDPHEAFTLLADHRGTAELWIDEKLACTLLHEGDPGVWMVAPHALAA